MELEFTSDQDELRDSIRTVLAKESPITLARAVTEGEADASKLWATMAELGWPALRVAEEHDGIGLGPIEAGILAEELGRVVAPGPILPTVSQFVPLLSACAPTEAQAELLQRVAAGELRGTLAIAEPGAGFDPAAVRAGVRRTGRDTALDGTKRFVMAGDDVDVVLVLAHDGDRPVAVVVPRDDLAPQRIETLDATRALVDIELHDVHVPAENVLEARDERAFAAAIAEATVALALEMVGTAQSIFDVTLDYAKQRQQFGVPIGSFQAVKHKFADMAIALERARSTAYFAALTLAEADERAARATSVAKIAAGDCQRLLAKEGVQLHGGIGYTWEHDLHLYAKRVKAGEALFGTSAWHRARLAEVLLA